PPAELNLAGGDTQDSSQDFKKGQEDFMSIRDYQQGDSKRAIHWRAYARDQGLVTKLFSEPVGDPMHFDYQMFDQIDPYQRVELRLSWLTFLVLEAAHQQTPFALTLPNKTFEPDISAQHLEKCLQALALYQLEDS
ncbi:MAG: DUF58 domain-containing protein, partial [Enterobacterales bacterium]|nr:DUF58 domain-containing protein [Enterobacterales bacterium]